MELNILPCWPTGLNSVNQRVNTITVNGKVHTFDNFNKTLDSYAKELESEWIT